MACMSLCVSARNLAVLMLPAFLLSCYGKQEALKLDKFKDIPKDMEGCTCTFSATAKELDSGSYLAVSDFDSSVKISVAGKSELLRRVGSNMPGADSLAPVIDTYANDRYMLIMKMHVDRDRWEETETIDFSGEMEVRNKDGAIFKSKITGNCGC